MGINQLNDMSMKTIFKYFAVVSAFIAVHSCANQEEMNPQENDNQVSTYEYVLEVAQDGLTKTTIDGLSILWDKDDKIGVACVGPNANGQNVYYTAKASGGAQSIEDSENYTPSTSATFLLKLPENFSPKVVGYPYDDKVQFTSGNSCNGGEACGVVLPAEQTGVKGNLPNNALAMVGKITNDGACQLYNVGAVIKFTITYDNIKSLKFEGNNSEYLAGLRYYFVKEGTEPGDQLGNVLYNKDTENFSAKSVTILPSGEVFEPGDYYFVVGQNKLENGFTITLTNSKGVQAYRRTESPFEIQRNHKYVNFGSDEGWYCDVRTGVAGSLGSASGTTATLYGIAPATVDDNDAPGFQISADGVNWSDVEGDVVKRYSTDPVVNTFNCNVADLRPETTYYYRATYTTATGIFAYGNTKEFKTYAKAQSAIIDLSSGPKYWPFTNLVYGTDLKIGTSSEALYPSEELTLTTAMAESFVVNAKNGVWVNKNTGCLTMGVYKEDYIKFPVIEGKKPVSVTMLVGGVAVASDPSNGYNELGRPSIRKVAAGETFETTDATGGDPWYSTPLYLYDSHTWNLADTEAAKYAMYFNRAADRNCYISYLEVVYVDADVVVDTRQPIENRIVSCTNTGTPGNGVWPFTVGRSSWTNTFEFNTSLYPDIKYSFPLGKPDYNGNPGLIVPAGTCMKIHAVEGYRLSYIKIRGYNDATTYSVSPNQDGSSQIAGPQAISSTLDSILEFNLAETSVNTDYYLTATNVRASIREMWITYEPVR